jgi:small nuclear ribonucleoprotein (snRNP)-like protein
VFYSFFKTLVDQEVTVELKNDLAIKGILKSVDQFLNIKLDDITVLEEDKYPHLVLCLRASLTADRGQKCVHSRVRRKICASSCLGGGYGAAGGCHAQRSSSALSR